MSTQKHLFLSDAWIAEATKLRAEVEANHGDQIPTPPTEVRVNVHVADIPHRDDLFGHVDTTGGAVTLDEGTLDEFDVAVSTDYITAAELFTAATPEEFMQSIMPAIFGGRIMIEGDLAELMPLMQQRASNPGDIPPEAREIGARIASFTVI